jgi:integrase
MSKRATPIPGTIEPVGNGCAESLVIYHIECSRFLYARFWMGKPHNKYKTKSMLTEVRVEARKRAKAFWLETIRNDAIGQPVFAVKKAPVEETDFIKISDLLFAEDRARVATKELGQSTYDRNHAIYNGDLKSFFGKMNCKDINYAKIQEYDTILRTKPKPLSPKTIKHHHNVLAKILKHAMQLEVIDRVPQFPKIVLSRNERPWLTPNEYTHLLKTIDDMVAEGTKVKKAGVVTQELKLMTMFLVNSYLRPHDIYQMKHRHIEKWDKDGRAVLKIWAESKARQHPPGYVIPNDLVVSFYSQLMEFNKGSTEPDDYVFLPKYKANRQVASGMLQKQFSEALKRADLKTDPNTGKKRDPYVLRHTCAMNALNAEMTVKALADKMRTSILMIDTTYGRHATEDNIGSEQIEGTLEHLFNAA